MKIYIEALNNCYQNGTDEESRSGKVRRAFGYQMRFNLNDGFPAITTKKLAWKSVVSELLWFLEGSDDERRLAEILYNKKRKDLKDKTIGEDEEKNSEKKIQNLTDKHIVDLEKRLTEKEKEIMTI